MNYKNDQAAAGIIALIFVFLLAGILLIITSFGVDRITLLSSKMFVDVAAAQMRYDVFSLQLMIWRLLPIIILLSTGISYWIVQTRTGTGYVDIGGTLMSSAELIIVLFLLMVFDLFGGAGLDAVVGVTNLTVLPVLSDLTTVIQYLGVTFYAMMFLLSVAAVAMFVIQQFKVIDYGGSDFY
jgi:hypothetical protein